MELRSRTFIVLSKINMEDDKQLSQLLNWSEKERFYLENNLNFLKSLNIEMVKDVFLGFLSRSPMFRFPVTNKVIRGRPNEKDDFFKVSQLTYNTEFPERIKMGRFNRERQSMFYGTIPNGNKESNPGVTSCIESFPNLLDENGVNGFLDFTIGIWSVKKPFDAFDLTFDTKDDNPFRNRIDELIINKISNSSDEIVRNILIEFWTFISHLTSANSTKEFDYVLSNILLDCINEMKFKDLPKTKGIVYPSSRTERLGTNIVLYPECVEMHLELDSVLVYRIFRKPNSKTYNVHPICEPVKINGPEFKIRRFSENDIKAIEKMF